MCICVCINMSVCLTWLDPINTCICHVASISFLVDSFHFISRHAEFGKAPRSIIVALLRYFERSANDRTRIERLVAQAR